MMPFKISLETVKQKIRLFCIAAVILALGLVFLIFRPLWVSLQSAKSELSELEEELLVARNYIRVEKKIKRRGHLLTRQEIALAIDEIAKKGESLDIDFIAISPHEEQLVSTADFQRLPIQMELAGQYKNIGQFLGALENMGESILVVKNFAFMRIKELLPKVKVRLIVELYLQGGTIEQK